MSYPVIAAPQSEPAAERVNAFVDHGAADVVEFRRRWFVENTTLSRSELPFDEVADVVKSEFRPAWEESKALSDRLDASTGEILAFSGFSDFIDLLGVAFDGETGCTAVSLGTRGDDSRSAPLVAQTWDYNVFYRDHSVIVGRAPDSGHDSVSLTTSLGHSYMGVNEVGVTVLINNLQSTEAQVGLPFSVAVQALLHRADTASEARDELDRLPVMSTHNYLIADETEAYNVEAGGGVLAVTHVDAERLPWVHTNHTVHDSLAGTIQNYSASSNRRYDRSLARLRDRDATGTVDAGVFDVPELFVDHDAPLCRHGEAPSDPATIATVWNTQSPPTLHVVGGNPCENSREQQVSP